MWAVKAFERENDSGGGWRDRLLDAAALAQDPDLNTRGERWSAEGPPYVAAVCIRDHWDDLTQPERTWCIDQVLAAVRTYANSEDLAVRYSATSLEAAVAAAFVIPKILAQGVDADPTQRVHDALAIALTHAIDNVATHAADGVGFYLGQTCPELVRRYARLLLARAATERAVDEKERLRPFPDRASREQVDAFARATARDVTSNDTEFAASDLIDFDLNAWHGQVIARPLLLMMSYCPNEPMAIAVYRKVAEAVSASWKQDRDRRGHRNHRLENDYLLLLARFLLRLTPSEATALCPPLIDAVDFAPEEVNSVIKYIVAEADRLPKSEVLWPLWQAFADGVLRARWIGRLDERHPTGTEFLKAMFLRIGWKENVVHWPQLEGDERRVDELFSALPPAAAVFESYAGFLFEIGDRSLPAAFARLAEKIRIADPKKALGGTNTIFFLEGILKRFVYGKPDVLKADAKIRDAVLFLLDALVEAGSSAAYRMRDDFVTPKG